MEMETVCCQPPRLVSFTTSHLKTTLNFSHFVALQLSGVLGKNGLRYHYYWTSSLQAYHICCSRNEAWKNDASISAFIAPSLQGLSHAWLTSENTIGCIFLKKKRRLTLNNCKMWLQDGCRDIPGRTWTVPDLVIVFVCADIWIWQGHDEVYIFDWSQPVKIFFS